MDMRCREQPEKWDDSGRDTKGCSSERHIYFWNLIKKLIHSSGNFYKSGSGEQPFVKRKCGQGQPCRHFRNPVNGPSAVDERQGCSNHPVTDDRHHHMRIKDFNHEQVDFDLSALQPDENFGKGVPAWLKCSVMKLPIADINAENAMMHEGHASEADINGHVDGWIKAHQAKPEGGRTA